MGFFTPSKSLVLLGVFGSPSIYFGTSSLAFAGGGTQDIVRKIETVSKELGVHWTKEFTLYSKDSQIDSYNQQINKKFLLVGVDKENKEVKLAGLVSITKVEENVSKPCTQEIKSGETTVDAYERVDTGQKTWSKVQKELQETGLWWKDRKTLSLAGMFAFGNCRDAFYKGGTEVEVIDELKSSDKKIGLQKLEISGGMQIINIQGIKNKGTQISAPAILTKKSFTDGLNLWAGLQGDGKARRSQGSSKPRNRGQGFVVVHKTLKVQDSKKNLITESNPGAGIQKIPLEETGEYYLWDPSFTHIKNGKFETKDGQELPWKIDSNLPFGFKLIK